MANIEHSPRAELFIDLMRVVEDAYDQAINLGQAEERIEKILGRHQPQGMAALREIAEQDAFHGVNGKPWRHWRIIAAEALNRLGGQ